MGISSLDSALAGLRISQRQIDVISTNVANVGTDGYTRKILPQVTQAVDGRAIGVSGTNIVRNVDLRLERDLWTQVSAVNYHDISAEYLGRVDQFHGAPDANVSVAAEVGKLQDSFAALASSPDDQFLLADVVNQAQDTADKINDLGDFYRTLRNDAQDEAESIIKSINGLTEQIAKLNAEIRFSSIGGRTTAETEDRRDKAIKDLSEFIEVSIFSRGDGIVTVQTLEGVELASDTASELFFRPGPLSSQSVYPDSAAGVFVGDPLKTVNADDITQANLGGKLGSLLELRDVTFPQKSAQLDELAHKMALRFEAQGLRLYTDSSGSVPADTPPDLTTDPITTVEYIGFSSAMRVNELIINDPSLIQSGTFGATSQAGSNAMIRRVLEHTFGDVDYRLAANSDPTTSVDIRSNVTGATTLQDWLGLNATNRLTGGTSLSNYTSIADMITTGGDAAFGAVGVNEADRFILRFDDPDIGTGPYDVEINLRTVPNTGTSAAQDLVSFISTDGDWASIVNDFNATVSVDSNGQLQIESSGNIEVVNAPFSPMTDLGFAFVGFAETLSEAADPYFDVQVGNDQLVRITIEPADTEVELLAKLNAVDGLAAEIDADGFLSVRAGNDFTTPDFGGDISIIGGHFTTNNASLVGTVNGRTTLDDGVNIVQSLFGTYTNTGGVISNLSPITDVRYQSETEAGSGVFVPFRTALLGANGTVETELVSSLSLKDFSQKMVNQLAQELSLSQARRADESALETLLEQKFLNDSGVNIDEELGNLIVVQTSYSAAARVISAVSSIFDELLAII